MNLAYVLASMLLCGLVAPRRTYSQTSSSGEVALSRTHRTPVMVVAAYHFVSKANVHNMEIDDPLKPKRQMEIQNLVEHLVQYRPTKIILEETSGTSDLEQHYREFLAGSFTLPASENYQIGFRLAKSLGLKTIFLTNARTDFDYPGLVASAKEHHEEGLSRLSDALSDELSKDALAVQEHGTVLDMYRFFNRQETIQR